MARRMPEIGGTFLQAESELGASNMVFGARRRASWPSPPLSPGISLMSEALSYIAGAQLPRCS